MGCDIHVYVEYKVNNGKWQAHPKHKHMDEDEFPEELSAVGRNYEMFTLLAGVRGYSDMSRPPKGFPTNASSIVRKAYKQWGGDGHTPSYISLKGLENIIKLYNGNPENGDYEIKPTDCVDMFYDYDTYDYDKRPPSWSTIISGCKRQADELIADYILLDAEPPTVKHRLVFWFDN